VSALDGLLGRRRLTILQEAEAMGGRKTLAMSVGALVAVAGLTLMPAGVVVAQDQSPERQVDEIFANMNTPDSAGCAVSVMSRGAITYKRGYGMASLEYGVPITPSSIFHVASVSKQFTAMAVALLAAEGKVAWHDDIREYVPEAPDYGKTITLEHLVHHTSGIRDQWSLLIMAGWRWEADIVRQEDVLNIISRQKSLNFDPGTTYLYSNTGFTLLAVVVERVSGMSLREFSEERIFKPLGMNDTHFHDDHQRIVPNRAYAYAPDSVYGLRISIPDFAIVGASSLFTTVEDLAKWDRNFYTGRVGGLEVIEQLQVKGVLNNGDEINYAFGLSHGTYRGLPTIGHGGADAGYRSDFVRFPEQELSVAVLCNYPHSSPGGKSRRVAGVYLADHFEELAEEEEERKEVELSPAELEQLAGVYAAAHADDAVSIQLREGKLYMGSGNGRQLVVLEGQRLWLRGSGAPAPYETSDAGGVTIRVPASGTEWIYTKTAPADTTPEALEAYTGTYYSDELGVEYTVKLEDGQLVLWNNKHGDTLLRPTYRDGFTARHFDLTFRRRADGSVDGCTISSSRVWNVRFDKVPSEWRSER
jgi:CubicO group peptidase (beta-lactamase class C family)